MLLDRLSNKNIVKLYGRCVNGNNTNLKSNIFNFINVNNLLMLSIEHMDIDVIANILEECPYIINITPYFEIIYNKKNIHLINNLFLFLASFWPKKYRSRSKNIFHLKPKAIHKSRFL